MPDTSLRVADPRSVDVCSFINRTELARFGAAKPKPRVSFSRCQIPLEDCGAADNKAKCRSVARNEVDGHVEIKLSLLDTSSLPEPPRIRPAVGEDPIALDKLSETKVAGHAVLKFPDARRACAYAVPFAQHAALAVHVAPRSRATAGNDLCAIAKTVTGEAIRKAESGSLNRLNLPAKSFAFANLCQRLKPGDVRLNGVSWDSHSSNMFGRQCKWKSGRKVVLSVWLRIGSVPREEEGANGPEKIEGRPSWTTTGVSSTELPDGFCRVETTHLRKQYRKTPGIAEVASVLLAKSTDDDVTEPISCDGAKKIAKRVWPKLPT